MSPEILCLWSVARGVNLRDCADEYTDVMLSLCLGNALSSYLYSLSISCQGMRDDRIHPLLLLLYDTYHTYIMYYSSSRII